MGLAEELAEYLRDFESLLIAEPSAERDLVLAIYVYLRLLGYDVVYEGGRSRPDLIVRGRNSEVPVEVKKADTASVVDKGAEQLFDYMKGTEWKKGILFVLDTSKTGTVQGKAKEENHAVSKYGRTVYIVVVRTRS